LRAIWGAKLYAAIISCITTGQANDKSALEAIAEVILPPKVPTLAA
jgi:hypothetical protein